MSETRSERRKTKELKVLELHHQGYSSREIAILVLAESQQFAYDLAKSDLAYYFKQSLDGIHKAKTEGWRIFNNPFVPVREKLLALKIIMQADETRFKLLSEGRLFNHCRPAVKTFLDAVGRNFSVLQKSKYSELMWLVAGYTEEIPVLKRTWEHERISIWQKIMKKRESPNHFSNESKN